VHQIKAVFKVVVVRVSKNDTDFMFETNMINVGTFLE